MEREIEREGQRTGDLESEIAGELERQEELLRQIDQDEQIAAVAEQQEEGAAVVASDTREAPRAPVEKELPAAIFDEEHRKIAVGAWGNAREIAVLVRSLDADRDGAPEEIRYHDEMTGGILRKESDRDYDGDIDEWMIYDAGAIARIEQDNDGDGKADEWQAYGQDGLMTAREIDRDANGAKDAFYFFQSGVIAEERHDTNATRRSIASCSTRRRSSTTRKRT